MSGPDPILDNPAGPQPQPAERAGRRGGPGHPLRLVGVVAVSVGVAALAAATFVLSYSGIHTVALQAGVTSQYARDYPLMLDAMLVIALAAVLALRGAGLPSRMLAWLTLLVVLGAAAGADTLHATGRRLPHSAGAITAAVLPWALVLIAFVLMLALLRHVRLRRHAGADRRTPADLYPDPGQPGQGGQQAPSRLVSPLPVRTPQPWNSSSIVPGFNSRLVPSAAAGAAAGAAAAAGPASPAHGETTPGGDEGPADTDRAPHGADDTGVPLAAAPEEVARQTDEQQPDTVPATETGGQQPDADPADQADAVAAVANGPFAAADGTAPPLAAEDGQRGMAEPGIVDPGDPEADSVPDPAAADDSDAGTQDPDMTDPATTDDAGDSGPAPAAADDSDAGAQDPNITDPATTAADSVPAPRAADDEVLEPAEPEIRQVTGDTEGEDMPVFHRMRSSPTPPGT